MCRRPTILARASTRCSRCARRKRTNSTRRASPKDLSDDAQAGDAAGASRNVVVANSFITTTCALAGRRSRPSRLRRKSAGTGAIRIGRTFITTTSFPCRTNGNIRGMRRGIWRFIASRWRMVDPDFAKEQLILLLREWYMHPNGQLPAYEWAFGDVNPPVHAWAAWRVYKIERRVRGVADRGFLEKVFHKLLLNFTWWVNRKDPDGIEHFSGRISGARQYRSVRPLGAAADRRASGTIRRDELDGHVLPEHAGHRAGIGEGRSARTKMSPASFSNTLCTSRTR